MLDEELKLITGKSISEFRQDLVNFGNKILSFSGVKVNQQSALPVKVSGTVLPPRGFIRPVPRRWTVPSVVICAGFNCYANLSVILAGVSLCTGDSAPDSFTGVNGNFSVPFLGIDVNGNCTWSIDSIGTLVFSDGTTYDVTLGVICGDGVLEIIASAPFSTGEGDPNVFLGTTFGDPANNTTDCSSTSSQIYMTGGTATIG